MTEDKLSTTQWTYGQLIVGTRPSKIFPIRVSKACKRISLPFGLEIPSIPQRRNVLLNSIALLLCFCASCGTVNPAPFQKFSNAVQQLDQGSAIAFANGVAWSETGFVSQVARDNAFQFNSLLLARAGNTWTARGQEPLFLEIRQARAALSSANRLVVDYAGLLAQLASADLVSEATFDQMAKDLNTNTTAVAADLSTVVTPPSAQGIGLFSAAAAESARLYIEHKRQADLLKVIDDNQPAIQSLSDWCQAGLNHLAADLYTSYSNQASTFGSQFGALGRATGKTLVARQSLIERQLQLNDDFLATEDTISALQLSYAALPKAHADLAKAIETPGTPLQGIESLYTEARRIQALDDQLKTSAKGNASTKVPKGGA